MPKDPKGEKHPADGSGTAMQAGPVNGGKPADAPNSDKDGEAAGAAQAKPPTSARRKEIDKAAASPRWEG